MRLLNTSNLQFSEFFDSEIPKYAILSHRWGETEISYHDMRKGRAQEGPGLAKIKDCCSLALERGWYWVWIDTCCIDKKSSAELSEAINSMFAWYTGAVECYAYLSDVVWKEEDTKGSRKSFETSKWFTRGWTLQELLAPKKLLFYDQRWKRIGDKSGDLVASISFATGIAVKYMHPSLLMHASVATKMSWASQRETSRKEDVAYSLLGLFGVNMPLLYGEGTKAFHRLQLEIIKISNDESIFAWESRAFEDVGHIIASSPSCFEESGDIMNINDLIYDGLRPPYTMTNRGLEFHVPHGSEWEKEDRTTRYQIRSVSLNCWRPGDAGVFHRASIQLIERLGLFSRNSCDKLDFSNDYKNKALVGARFGDDYETGNMTRIYIEP